MISKKIVLFVFLSFLTPKIYANVCASFHENDDFSGWNYSLQDGQKEGNLDGIYMERRTWHGIFRRWSGSDKVVGNSISSITVYGPNSGCPNPKLTVWVNPNFSGDTWNITQTGFYDGNHVRSWINGTFYHTISSATCTCK